VREPVLVETRRKWDGMSAIVVGLFVCGHLAAALDEVGLHEARRSG
jgi:hypothetical protein